MPSLANMMSDFDIPSLRKEIIAGAQPDDDFFDEFYRWVDQATESKDLGYMKALLNLAYFIESYDILHVYCNSDKFSRCINDLRENTGEEVIQYHRRNCFIS